MELSYRTAEENRAAHLHDLGFRDGALNIRPEAQKTMKNRHTGLQKNEIMQFAATQMDLEIFISSEGSQTEREKYCMAFSGYRIQNETI